MNFALFMLQSYPVTLPPKLARNYEGCDILNLPPIYLDCALFTKTIYYVSPENAKKMYAALQVMSMGKDLIFAGEQETGKSTLATALITGFVLYGQFLHLLYNFFFRLLKLNHDYPCFHSTLQ